MTTIREFYQEKYPESDDYRLISKTATFENLTDDVIADGLYDYLGTADETILTRVFQQLAKIRGVEYSTIYEKYRNGFRVANGVKYRIDWNCDGHIRMLDTKTLDTYHKLKYDFNAEMHDCFFAFSNQQFKEGIERFNLQDKKIYSAGMGLYGTKEGIDDFYEQYKEPEKKIKEQCDPQEVYFFEYNNHESMISWDGDTEAIRIIINYWGVDIAKKIVRRSAFKSIDEIIKEK